METIPLIILFPLISGFLFASNFAPLRYKIVRADNNKLYFISAYYGFFLFILASLIFFFFLSGKVFLNIVLIAIYESVDFLIPYTQFCLILILAITIVLGPSVGAFLNWILPFSLRKWFYERAIADHDFDQLFYRSLEKQMPILLTLTCGKIYVGRLLQTNDPSKEFTELKILPLMSGYTTVKTKKIRFTTYYDEIYDKILQSENEELESQSLRHLHIDDFEVVIPFREIQSCRLFDLAAFYEFSNQAN